MGGQDYHDEVLAHLPMQGLKSPFHSYYKVANAYSGDQRDLHI